MEFIKMNATLRSTIGKGPARRMRNAGVVPGVLYRRAQETLSLALSPTELTQALSGPLRVNTPLNLVVTDGEKTVTDVLVIIRDHQYNPVTRQLLHVDFLAVDETTPIQVIVPFFKASRSVGEQMGGTLTQHVRELPLTCTPATVPADITMDVANLNIDEIVHVKDLKLPEGVSVRLPANASLISITTTRVVVDETATAAAAGAAAKKKK